MQLTGKLMTNYEVLETKAFIGKHGIGPTDLMVGLFHYLYNELGVDKDLDQQGIDKLFELIVGEFNLSPVVTYMLLVHGFEFVPKYSTGVKIDKVELLFPKLFPQFKQQTIERLMINGKELKLFTSHKKSYLVKLNKIIDSHLKK